MKSLASLLLMSTAGLASPFSRYDVAPIEAPMNVPGTASKEVSHQFISWAVEGTALVNYTSEFSANIFSDFAARTGAPIILRVGGTSLDHSTYDLSMKKDWKFAKPGETEIFSDHIFGAPFFEAHGALPGAKWVIQAPLVKKNASGAAGFTRESIRAIGGVQNLYGIEIGNEPDTYGGWRGPEYASEGYAQDVKDYMEALLEEVPDLPGGRIFQVWDDSILDAEKFNVTRFMEAMSNKNVDLSRIQSVAQHYYHAFAGNDGEGMQEKMLSHKQIVSKAKTWFQEGVDLLASKYKEIPYIVSELGSSIGPNPDGQRDDVLSGSLGTAVWAVDFCLHLMTMGVERLHFQQGHNWVFNIWMPKAGLYPTGSPPHVLGGMYGLAMVADFIGAEKGTLRVAPLETGDGAVTAYAGYVGGKLAKVALTNMKLWDGSSGTRRPKKSVTLKLGLPEDVTSVKVEKLLGPSGKAMEGMTWAGLDWTAESKGKPVKVKDTDDNIEVKEGGSITVDIQATSALLLSW